MLLTAKEKPTEIVKVMNKGATPVLIAAKNGITEIVREILEHFPIAIHDMDEHKKNLVLLAAENRHPLVYQLLLQKSRMKESIFLRVDDEGNSALHLAANMVNFQWPVPGASSQMQWEIKWYEVCAREHLSFSIIDSYFPRPF